MEEKDLFENKLTESNIDDNDQFLDEDDELSLGEDEELEYSGIENNSDFADEDDGEEELVDAFQHEDIDKYADISGNQVVMEEIVYDAKGNPVETQIDGDMFVEIISMEDILIPPRGKQFVSDVSDLEESIHLWGLVEPIHVVPHKGKYFLVHGYRRFLALRNMGYSDVPAVVDSTRPKEIIRYLEVISNNIQPYNFIEMMEIGEFIEERQHSFSHDTIENILGLPSGHYLKAKFINSMKETFEDVFLNVVKGKTTIELGYKKIERELQKMEDEENDLNLVPEDYGNVDETEHVQDVDNRHILDPALRKYIEGRDQHTCQACGMGQGEPDLASVFEVHHMIPVKHRGPDKKTNLILLCPNCHSLAHAYDEGKFKPSQDMVNDYDTIYNVVVLGNIIRVGLPKDYPGEPWGFYMERVKQSWV